MFPDEFGSGLDRTRTVWDLTRRLPVPLRQWHCPLCGTGVLAMKDWKLHRRDDVGSGSPWRCDVRMKCMTCGFVPTFGVLLPQDVFDRARGIPGVRVGQWIHWRDGRRALEEAE